MTTTTSKREQILSTAFWWLFALYHATMGIFHGRVSEGWGLLLHCVISVVVAAVLIRKKDGARWTQWTSRAISAVVLALLAFKVATHFSSK